jgi:Ca-activated chloride channel family protein
MQQQKDSLALIQFETAGKMETSKMRKAKVYHNIGVICQGHQMFSEAVEAYKESLRNNPKDDETRYNLALCQRQMKNQKKDKNKQNQDNKKDQKKNEGNDKKNQGQNDENKKKDNKDKKQQPKEQMSKDNAEQLLQAALQEEKNTQQKMKKQQSMPQKRRLQKNW